MSLRTDVVRQAPGPVLTVAPTVTGTLQQGKKLTGFQGTWTSGGTITYAFQWYRCDANAAHCSSIHGSTKASYTEVAKDVGQTLALTVRATDSTGTTAAYAAVAGLVAAPTSTLVANAQTGLAGNAAVGTALTAQSPTWVTAPTTSTLCVAPLQRERPRVRRDRGPDERELHAHRRRRRPHDRRGDHRRLRNGQADGAQPALERRPHLDEREKRVAGIEPA